MTTVLRDTDTDEFGLTELAAFFDREQFDTGFEELGEFEIVTAVRSSTRGLLRYALAAGGWHVYAEGYWRTIDRADLMWVISNLLVETGEEGDVLTREDMRTYDKKAPANRYLFKVSKKSLRFYKRMRRRGNDFRYIERLLTLMEMSTAFRIQVMELERNVPPGELRYA